MKQFIILNIIHDDVPENESRRLVLTRNIKHIRPLYLQDRVCACVESNDGSCFWVKETFEEIYTMLNGCGFKDNEEVFEMLAARDDSTDIYLYGKDVRLKKGPHMWVPMGPCTYGIIPSYILPFVTWEDDKPTPVLVAIKKKYDNKR